jgi:hypothetical protein
VIGVCEAYLVGLVKAAGVSAVFIKEEDLQKHQGQVFASVLVQDDSLEKDGSRVARTADGYRRRLHRRTTTFEVRITARTPADAEAIRVAVLTSLASRIDDGAGNAVIIRPRTAAREEDKSLLASKATAVLDVEFLGGVYRDESAKRFPPAATDIRLETEITI